jgi:hypothetical protein
LRIPRKQEWIVIFLGMLFVAANVVNFGLWEWYQDSQPIYDNIVSLEPEFQMDRRPYTYTLRSSIPCVGLIEVLNSDEAVVGMIDPSHPDNVGERCDGQVKLEKGHYHFRVIDRSPDVHVYIWQRVSVKISLKPVLISSGITLMTFVFLIFAVARSRNRSA